MTIPLVNGEELKTNKKNKYRKEYSEAIESHIPFIDEQIKLNGNMLVKVSDMAEAMGLSKHRDPTTIYSALKYVLFDRGIYVRLLWHSDDTTRVLEFRRRKPEDKLPKTLENLRSGR